MKKNIKDYKTIENEILSNKKYQKLSLESHHGLTRMEHSLRVSRNVYRLSRKLNLDYESATRAALLHDFFFNEEFESNNPIIIGILLKFIVWDDLLSLEMIIENDFFIINWIKWYKVKFIKNKIDNTLKIIPKVDVYLLLFL